MATPRFLLRNKNKKQKNAVIRFAVAWSFLRCFCHRLFLIGNFVLVDSPRFPKSSGMDPKKALNNSAVINMAEYYNIMYLFFIPFILFALLFSLFLQVVTQIRGHTAGSSPPLPTTVRALHFHHDEISAVSSLVDSRRIVLTHAGRSQQLISFFMQINAKSHHGRIRTHGSILLQ